MKFRGFSLRSTPSSATSRGPPRGGGYGTLRFQMEPRLSGICGLQLAKERTKRTCGTRVAGLRGAKLRPAAPLRAQIQHSKLLLGLQPAENKHVRQRTADLRRPRSRPADLLRGRFQSQEISPQPSGRACDDKAQPSARGRLRAASRCATDFAGKHFHQNQRLRAAATSCEVAN